MQKPQAPHTGVFVSYKEAVTLTAGRILESLPETKIPESVSLHIKFGFDGSGGHAIYKQIGNEQTNNIISSMFCPLKITASGHDIWLQNNPNSSSIVC